MKGFKGTGWFDSLRRKLQTGRAAKENGHSRHVSNIQTEAAEPNGNRIRRWILIPAGVLVIAGSVFFAGRAYVQANTTTFYHVYMNEQHIGTIENDAQLDKLLEDKQKYYQDKYPDTFMVLHTEGITTEADRAFKPEIQTEATLAKLDGMLKAYARGVELKLDGETVAVVKDQQTAQAAIEAAKAKYAPAAAAAEEGVQKTSASASSRSAASDNSSVESVKIMEEVSISAAKADPNKVLSVEEAVEVLTASQNKPVTYTVKEGDTISSIASEHGMTSSDVLKLNPDLEEKYLKIGSTLELSVPEAPLTVRTVETVTEKMPSKAETIVRESNELPLGKRKVVRAGQDGVKEVTYVVTKENGRTVSKQWIGQQVITESIPEVVYKGTKVEKKPVTTTTSSSSSSSSSNSSSSKMFAWPVSGARITSSYGARWGSTHQGIDMVGGRTIMASASGKVVFAGSKGTYGKAVIIDHGNGYQTLYGHLSSISVSYGQRVSQGSKLGIMGSTGRSTGIHLHFEIRKNGVQQNPMKYL